jgi:hypothetical protein
VTIFSNRSLRIEPSLAASRPVEFGYSEKRTRDSASQHGSGGQDCQPFTARESALQRQVAEPSALLRQIAKLAKRRIWLAGLSGFEPSNDNSPSKHREPTTTPTTKLGKSAPFLYIWGMAVPPFKPPGLPTRRRCAPVPCLWRRLLLLDLAAGDIDYQVDELGGIAGRCRR